MAEAFVATVLSRLAPLIEKKVRAEVCLLLDANDEIENLSSKLEKIHQVLGDAERKGVTDPRVKSWLDKLQEIAYEIDDVVDEWEVENIKQQYEQLEASSESSDDLLQKVCSFLESVCLCFKQTVRRRSIALHVKNISKRLDSIAQDNKKEFNFIPDVGGASQVFRPVESTSFVELSEIYGRDLEKRVLMDEILSPSSNSGGASSSSRGEKNEIQIISIVGAGGMGKTTLAQLVFDEIKHKNEFKPIWICVSDPFDGYKIAQTILNELGISYPSNSGFETLLNNIERSISSKKILLVLDDVWTEDDTMWKQLKKSLKSGAPGSRILVTTRKDSVAKEVMRSTYTHELGRLSDSDCWSVLSHIALYGRSKSDEMMLEETGRKIAKKCNGMPLAAKTMGGLLYSKTFLHEWEDVLKSEMWELKNVIDNVFPYLTLSYNELRPEEKLCFSYCAIFPKDYDIKVDELIRIWMSQGFLSSKEDMEQQGREYFDRLAMCSFFQDFERDEVDNRIDGCKMHDIVHDFAQSLTKNEILVDEGEKIVSGLNARHLSILKYKDYHTNASLFRKLRSLIFHEMDGNYMLDVLIPTNWFSNLKRLRLLTIRRSSFENISNEIGNLIHLRYLDIRNNFWIKELPEAICDLYNLQTLNIEYCYCLVGLPQGIDKLKNLRHLLNGGISREFVYPQAFEKLTNLRTLSYYCGELGYLKDLNQLQGSLDIRVRNLDELDVMKADLKSKKLIQQLELDTHHFGVEILEALEPHPYLESLEFISCVQLPKWIGTLSNLKRLFVCGSFFIDKNVSTSLIPLQKLPILEYLELSSWSMEHLGHDFFGTNNETSPAFPKLKTLRFESCGEWKEWEDISSVEEENDNDAIISILPCLQEWEDISSVEEENDYDAIISILPCLQELELNSCSKLEALPHRLLRKASSLREITLWDCAVLEDRYDEDIGEDRDKLPNIQFTVLFKYDEYDEYDEDI